MQYMHDVFIRARGAHLDAQSAPSRRRIRQQVQRIRQTRREAGDVALAVEVLRYLRRSYSDLVRHRRNLPGKQRRVASGTPSHHEVAPSCDLYGCMSEGVPKHVCCAAPPRRRSHSPSQS